MQELSYLQIELTGKCENACQLCLPKKLKTGVHMSWGEVLLLRKQIGQYFQASLNTYRPKITFAGYGNPVEHPGYQDIIDGFLDYELTVTCRVDDLPRAGNVRRANVSIASLGDAQKLLERMNACETRLIVPHVVLTSDESGAYGEELLDAIGLLVRNMAFFEKVSVAKAVVLCEEHRDAVTKQNINANAYWKALRQYATNLGDYAKDTLVLWDEKPRKAKCSWRQGGLLINSRLQVLPCCNLPCVEPMADLHSIDLMSFLKFYSHPHNKYGECDHCPDLGPRP